RRFVGDRRPRRPIADLRSQQGRARGVVRAFAGRTSVARGARPAARLAASTASAGRRVRSAGGRTADPVGIEADLARNVADGAIEYPDAVKAKVGLRGAL